MAPGSLKTGEIMKNGHHGRRLPPVVIGLARGAERTGLIAFLEIFIVIIPM